VRPTVRASDQSTAAPSIDAAGVAANQRRPRRNGPVNIPAASPASTSVIVLPFVRRIEDLLRSARQGTFCWENQRYVFYWWVNSSLGICRREPQEESRGLNRRRIDVTRDSNADSISEFSLVRERSVENLPAILCCQFYYHWDSWRGFQRWSSSIIFNRVLFLYVFANPNFFFLCTFFSLHLRHTSLLPRLLKSRSIARGNFRVFSALYKDVRE